MTLICAEDQDSIKFGQHFYIVYLIGNKKYPSFPNNRLGIDNPFGLSVCGDHIKKIPSEKIKEDYRELNGEMIFATAEAAGKPNYPGDNVSWTGGLTIRDDKFYCFDKETCKQYLPNSYEILHKQLSAFEIKQFEKKFLKAMGDAKVLK